MSTSPPPTTTATATAITDTNVSQLQTIEPSLITLLSENIGIVMESSVQRYASMKAKDLPTVRLGRVNEKVYAINHYDVILGCIQSKKNVQCIIEEYDEMSDVMVQHFRDVISNDIINTPRIYGSVDSLQEKLKTDKASVLKILGIDKNQYVRLMTISNNNNMSEAAISKLEKIVTELSKRKGLTAIQASIPIYVLEKISRVSDVKQQLQLIQIIESDLQTISDTRFFWMTPEQIDSILQLIRQNATHTENKREESTVAEFVGFDEIGKKPEEEKVKEEEERSSSSSDDAATNDPTKAKPRKKDSKTSSKPNPSSKTKQIIDTIPNMVVIPDEKGKPDLLVDKKNGAVTRLDAKATKGIIKTEQVTSKRLYSIPLDVTKFLGMGDDNGDNNNGNAGSSNISAIRHKNISGIEALKSFVQSQQDQTQRYTVFWNTS